jgi:putative transposase
VDFVRRWSERTEISAGRFIEWLDITASKSYDRRERYGKVNEHNGWVPRDFWLEKWEKQVIVGFHLKNPLEGYRGLTFMMLDADVVAVSPSSGGGCSANPAFVALGTRETAESLRCDHRPAMILSHY